MLYCSGVPDDKLIVLPKKQEAGMKKVQVEESTTLLVSANLESINIKLFKVTFSFIPPSPHTRLPQS